VTSEAGHDTVLKMSEQEAAVRLERCPFYRDAGALLEHAIASMVKLTECGSPRVALEASRWLAEYAEGLRSSERRGKAEEASGASPDGSGPWRVC
jgi:hypothetical protein